MGHTVVLLRHSKGHVNEEAFREYYHLEDALREERGIDGAIVCSPTTNHLEDVRGLIRNGIPFLLEKPPAYDLRSTLEMMDIIEKNPVIAYDIAFNLRYHPIIKFVKGFLPRLGRIYMTNVYVGYYLPYWRKGIDYRESTSAKKDLGGGVHVELSHEIDYTVWLLGAPRKVLGYINHISDLEISTEDICSALMKYDDGSVVEIHFDYLSHEYLRGGRIVAQNGTMQWNWSPANGKILYYGQDTKNAEEVFSLNTDYDFNATYIEELDHFVGILNGAKKSAVTISDAITTMKIVHAIEVSNQEERWVNA